MNNERNNTTAGGIGFCGLLAVAFIVLKLTGVINWSWLWVLAPIWIPTAITLAIIVIVLVAIEEMADVQIMLDQLRIIFHRSTEEVEEAKLERLKNRLDGRNNWQGSSLHKWIEKQFSAGGDGHE